MKKRNATLPAVGLVAAALLAAPAAAHVYVVPPDETLVDGAPAIVYGEVEYTTLAPGEASTDALVRVSRVLKGFVPGSAVVVRQRGGGRVRVLGLPMLRGGDRVLLFLRPGRDGIWRTVGKSLGIFFEDRGHLTRHEVVEDGFRRLDRFSRWIEDRQSGRQRSADYVVDELPGPRRVASPYRLVPQICHLFEESDGASDAVARWPQWDPGYTRRPTEDPLEIRVEDNWDETAVSRAWTDPLTEVDAASGVWNAVTGSVAEPPDSVPGTASDAVGLSKAIEAVITVDLGATDLCTVEWKQVSEGDKGLLYRSDKTGDLLYKVGEQYRRLSDDTDYTVADDESVGPHLEPECVSGTLGEAVVSVACHHEGVSTLHAIPGGSGKAYRLDVVNIRVSQATQTSTASGLRYILAHELGHALGIAHSEDPNALMAPQFVGVSTAWSLTADDQNALRALYPTGASSGGSPPSGGGGPPPGGTGSPPTEEPPPTEDPVAPLPVPPLAGFDADAGPYDEAEDLWRARSGEAVRFVSTSTGAVASVHWDFGDGTTSRRSTVDHVWQRPGFYDVVLTVSGAGSESSVSRTYLVEAGEPRGTCVTGPETICLQDARYEVSVEWRTSEGESGAGRVVHAGTNDSGMFSFFARDNWEILVKVLNGCSINGHHWVYAASATDLGYAIRVVDTATGEVRRYDVSPGAEPAVGDPAAFADSCKPM